MKIALGIEYDGAAFRGWQSQRCGQTVQDVVEQALSQTAGENIRLYAAGRTDSGVHATLMPAHFETTVRRQPSGWIGAANAHLPAAVKILWAKPVQKDFHARHCARRRYYQYVLLNRATPPGILRDMTGYCHIPLDIGAMRQAARFLRGEHDFSAFRAAACQASSPVRHLYHLRICKKDDWFVFSFCGNGFLHHMIRNIIGTLITIGQHRQPPQWARLLLAAGDRCQAAKTAAASGLYFNGVLYDTKYKLPPCRRSTPLGGGSVPLPE